MRLLLLLLTLHLLPSPSLMAQKAPKAYELFNANGKKTKYKKLLKDLRGADVVLFGESHNDALGHWLQNELIRAWKAQDDRPLHLGMEMFEADQQDALDQYVAGKLEAKDLDKVGEGLWPNFATDYQPIVQWAASNGVTVTGTNVPRPYARLVFKEGFEALAETPDESGKSYAPYPIPYDPELKAYKEMLDMMGGGHGGANFPKAQAIKDATMAHRISQRLQPGERLFHLNGSFHSDFQQGIYWYLKNYRPELKIVTVTMIEQKGLKDLEEENKDRADYIFAIPTTMTKTY